MKNKGKAGKSPQVKIETKEEDKKDDATKNEAGKSKKKKKAGEKDKEKEKEKEKKPEIAQPPKIQKFNLDFIYRREKYTLKNLMPNFLVSGVKKLIAKKLSIDIKSLKFYYLEKELKEESDKINVYDMIKKNTIQFFEVKKELAVNENIISLSAQNNLVYQVKCTEIDDYKKFMERIDKFFIDFCIEKRYLCEPASLNSYIVNFSCEDHCIQFKRYMVSVKKTDKMYTKSDFILIPVDKAKVIAPRNEIKIDVKKSMSNYINVGPFTSEDERKRMEEKEDKKKWIDEKGFS